MACVDVETPSVCGSPGFRSGLQVCLQKRRSQEQLFQQDIMRCLKTPAATQKQIRCLETTRPESVLKQKIKRRPARSELVRLILKETQAEVSHQAAQLKLKRVWLADRQSEKLALHTGALELQKSNTQPIDSAVKEGHSDGGDALSLEQMTDQRPPREDPELTDVPRSALQTSADFLKAVSINEQPVHLPVAATQISTIAASPAKVGTTIKL
ncbi:hypothetical protein GJAV_G00218230 [Gymnothorax javanicus]|nr:hypothetical protein GJAV_G00218230 [Gymnothorax javanicus]